MACQTCSRHAQHEATHGALRARCCSERCGRELFAGLTQHSDGTIHAAAASPLGRAIARETRETADYRMPAHVAAQLVGALQRIGPKRGADDAELPASTQAAAPTSIDWVADLPRDVWGKILPMLDRKGLRSLASLTHGTRALMQSDVGRAEKYRRQNTPLNAVLQYISHALTTNTRSLIRMAYPDIAELTLGWLLAFDVDEIVHIGFGPNQYEKLIVTMRAEAGRDGDNLFVRPIQVPIPMRTLILERRLVKSAKIVPAMAGALVMYVTQYEWSGATEFLMSYVHSYMLAVAPPPNSILETPDTPCFFSYPYIFNLRIYKLDISRDSIVPLFASGVDPTRTDAGFWFAEVLLRTRDDYTIDSKIDEIIAATSLFRFDGPRTNGQMSLLYMTKEAYWNGLVGKRDFMSSLITRILREQNLLGAELRAPVVMNDRSGNTILHLLCRTQVNSPIVSTIVSETQKYNNTTEGIANPPLLVRNTLGEIPIETMIAEAVAEPDTDDMYFIFDNRVVRIVESFGMSCHLFAHSIVHNKPILAIVPADFHQMFIDAVDFTAATADAWNTPDVKSYLIYMATQVHTGNVQLYRIVSVFDTIFRRLDQRRLASTIINQLRPLMAPALEDQRLQRWFK